MSTIVVAIIVAFSATVSPLLLAYINARHRRAEKQEDYARQDQVAERAAAAALALQRGQADAARLLLEANKFAAENAARVVRKLDEIHLLVNSNMSAALQAELDATTRELAMMREVVALRETAGHKPSPEALAAIISTGERIDELTSLLQDRREAQDKAADAQAGPDA